MRNRLFLTLGKQYMLLATILLLNSNFSNAQTISDSSLPKKKLHVLPWYIQRFSVEAGAFVSSNNTDIKIGSETRSTATLIDLENDLGFKNNTTTFLAKAQWRISKRSLFECRYYNLARSSGYTLKKDIDFADTTFRISASVNAFFNTRIFEFTYGYCIISRPRFELGVKLGVHLVSAKVGLATDNNFGSGKLVRNYSAVKPLPDLGLWGGYALNKRWALQASAGYFYTDKGIKKITVAHIKIITYNLLLHYRATRHLELCGGYMGYSVKMNAEIAGITGYLDWGYHGPTLKACFVFGKKPGK